MNDKQTLIIIPTYNEIENIGNMIKEISDLNHSIDILIVDDSSPDGTGKYIKDLQETFNNLYLLEREGKLGLGTAYVAGFKFALQNGYEFIFEMDADFSHDPKEIPNFLEAIKEADLVIGSRYITGVNVVNWPLRRLFLTILQIDIRALSLVCLSATQRAVISVLEGSS